jgi:hypothetical protein
MDLHLSSIMEAISQQRRYQRCFSASARLQDRSTGISSRARLLPAPTYPGRISVSNSRRRGTIEPRQPAPPAHSSPSSSPGIAPRFAYHIRPQGPQKLITSFSDRTQFAAHYNPHTAALTRSSHGRRRLSRSSCVAGLLPCRPTGFSQPTPSTKPITGLPTPSQHQHQMQRQHHPLPQHGRLSLRLRQPCHLRPLLRPHVQADTYASRLATSPKQWSPRGLMWELSHSLQLGSWKVCTTMKTRRLHDARNNEADATLVRFHRRIAINSWAHGREEIEHIGCARSATDCNSGVALENRQKLHVCYNSRRASVPRVSDCV